MKKQSKHLAQLVAVVLATSFTIVAPPVLAHGNGHLQKKDTTASISADEHEFGREGDPKQVSRTVHIDMNDTMRFNPSQLKVKQGETIRFVVKNKGMLPHELVLGTTHELKAHGELMKKNPEMEHDAPYMAHVVPGGEEEMVWRFTKAGNFTYGCLAPGHFEAGMRGAIRVVRG